MSSRARNIPDVVIIGAGAAGLATAKSLLEKGLKPILLEKSNRFGGLWNYGKSGGSPLYKSLKANVSKQLMSFSDFAFDANLPDFPSHEQILNYLQSYVAKYELAPYIEYGVEVVDVTIEPNQFTLTVKKEGRLQQRSYAKLVVASGRFDVPNVPQLEGISSFSGELIHSKAYDTPEKFKGKRVLIVGSAASGMDIAAEQVGVANRVSMSARSTAWVIPYVIDGKPADHALSWLKARLPKGIREMGFKKILQREYAMRGAPQQMERWPFTPPPVDLEKTRFVPQEKMISLLLNKKVTLFNGINNIEGNTITFQDGNHTQADVIILATGYQTQFPFFKQADITVENNYIGLYKHIFHPQHPNLAFIGMCNIVGAAYPLFEMQSRLVAEVFTDAIKLPIKSMMQNQIQRHKTLCDQKGIDPMRVQALSYLDELAAIIGVSPRFLRHTDVLKPLVFGPLTASRYRLNGPEAKPETAKKILKVGCPK